MPLKHYLSLKESSIYICFSQALENIHVEIVLLSQTSIKCRSNKSEIWTFPDILH